MDLELILKLWTIFGIVAIIIGFIVDSSTLPDLIARVIHRGPTPSNPYGGTTRSDPAFQAPRASITVLATVMGPGIFNEAKDLLAHCDVTDAIASPVSDGHDILSNFMDSGLDDHSIFDTIPSVEEIPIEILDWLT